MSSSSSSRSKNRVRGKSTIEREKLANDLASEGIEMAPCTNCQRARVKKGEEKPRCILGARSKKCSECVRKNCKSCDVSLSYAQWERLREARDKLRREIEALEEEEVEITQRLQDRRMKKIRLRKQLRLAERRAEDKTGEALDELEAGGPSLDEASSEEPVVEIPELPFLHGILEMPLDSWEAVCGPDSEIPWSGVLAGSFPRETAPCL